MRGDILIATMMAEKFYLSPTVMNSLQEFATSKFKIDMSAINNTSSNSTTMQVIKDNKGRGSIAVINVDGAMYKKDMSGFCMQVSSYQKIQEYINQAEEMYRKDEIQKAIFRVSTPGGSVHGVDALENDISKMSMPTITFCEDQVCSAGIYAFTASDRIVAAPMTELGSIGVVSQFIKNKDMEIVTITSSRASNKRLDLTKKEDQDKYRKELDIYEERFYQVVQKNTGFTAEQIEKEFDSGGTIFAEQAKKINFIDEVLRFEELIEKEFNNMGGNNAAIPTASGNKLAKNSNTGVNMEFNQENFNILMEQNKVLSANRNTLSARNETLKVQLEEATTALDTTIAEKSALNENLKDMEAKLSEVVAKTEDTETRVREAFACNVDASTAISMLKANDALEASKLANDFRGSNGASGQSDASFKAKESPWGDNSFKRK